MFYPANPHLLVLILAHLSGLPNSQEARLFHTPRVEETAEYEEHSMVYQGLPRWLCAHLYSDNLPK